MKYIFSFAVGLLAISLQDLSSHPYCITQDYRKNNDLTTEIIGTTNPVYPGCSCSCAERRFGGNDVCVTCNHRHSANTSDFVNEIIAPGLVEINEWIAKQKAFNEAKIDYSDEEME